MGLGLGIWIGLGVGVGLGLGEAVNEEGDEDVGEAIAADGEWGGWP